MEADIRARAVDNLERNPPNEERWSLWGYIL